MRPIRCLQAFVRAPFRQNWTRSAARAAPISSSVRRHPRARWTFRKKLRSAFPDTPSLPDHLVKGRRTAKGPRTPDPGKECYAMTSIDIFYQGEGIREIAHFEADHDHTFAIIK